MGCGSSSAEAQAVEYARRQEQAGARASVFAPLRTRNRGSVVNDKDSILQKHPEYWTDPAFYENNLEEMFNVYDTNGDGKLDKTELAQIAAHGVKRFLDHYKKALLIDRPNLKDKELEAITKKEMPYILPGKTEKEAVKKVAKALLHEMQRTNNKGKKQVTKVEFMSGWKATHQKFLSEGAVKNMQQKDKEAALGCSIM